jgi:hypothetical protein
MNVFGFEIKRKNPQEQQVSVVSPTNEDGSTVVQSAAAGYYAQVMNLEATIKNENDLIRRYREIARYPDCESAIDDIANEAIIAEEDSAPVKIVMDDTALPPAIKDKVYDEFKNVLKLLKFDQKGHDIFKNWYVDGRLYYQILVDEKNPKKGIQELRPIDPRKIRKVKNIVKDKTPQGVEVIKSIEEYYMYNDKGINETNINGIKLPVDSIIYVPSGVVDQNSGLMLSHLHKAIKLVNQLKMMEDALVIYRISRAPERRVFYVDVGNLPKIKAEQYVNDLMNKFRNKIVYDATTGEVRDDRKHMSMMEDFWMPRREGGKGTEITTLAGGQNLGQIEDIEFFQNKLYQALNVPASRLKSDSGFNLGRSSEITRDEIKFTKFVARIRKKFASVFLDALRIQLVTKGILGLDDWDEIVDDIRFDFIRDNHFAEIKESEILQARFNLLQAVDPFVGKYYSPTWVKKNILYLEDHEIEEMDAENEVHNQEQLDQEVEDMKAKGEAQAYINQTSAELAGNAPPDKAKTPKAGDKK